jgi:hypothetical protein
MLNSSGIGHVLKLPATQILSEQRAHSMILPRASFLATVTQLHATSFACLSLYGVIAVTVQFPHGRLRLFHPSCTFEQVKPCKSHLIRGISAPIYSDGYTKVFTGGSSSIACSWYTSQSADSS